MSDSILMDTVLRKVAEVIEKRLEILPSDELMQDIRDVITGGLVEYRGSRSIYETALGGFIIEQNPYATWEHLVFPNLPMNPDGENQWVRKSGVLAENHAGRPLAPDKPIPGGMVVNFSYADWEYLRDTEGREGITVPLPGAASSSEPDPLPAPASDPEKPKGDLPPDFTTFYPHNIVKSVRLKYRYLDRLYPPTGEVAEAQGKRDVHTGYILILYSGSDSN
jgi:hypothetical protein